ncbi:hypothetical protein PWEIH_16563 [Listeria weihenstephanensis FSL R9-0317]|nr:hypothetical protein PWEIH_16563 [Listeria weihenstephanensis FSL R9-0317]
MFLVNLDRLNKQLLEGGFSSEGLEASMKLLGNNDWEALRYFGWTCALILVGLLYGCMCIYVASRHGL